MTVPSSKRAYIVICDGPISPSLSAEAIHHDHLSPHRQELMGWLETQFSRIGLEAYTQNYSATRPAALGQQVHTSEIYYPDFPPDRTLTAFR